MSKISNFFKLRWKLILNILTIVALVIFIWAIRDQLIETWQNLHDVQWWILLLIIPLKIWNYDVQARMYRDLFAIVGNKFKYRQMYETALELNFVNTVFPSGGVSGISYFGARVRSDKITAGRATLVHLMKLILLFLSFEVLLAMGLFLVALEGEINSILLMITAIVSTALVFGTALLAYVLGGQGRVDAFHKLIKLLFNNLITIVKGRKTHYELYRVKFLLDELHGNFTIIKTNYKELKRPLFYALIANLTEIFTIYVVYAAFGHWINPGAIILAYSVANIAGFISVLPGGVGVYEAIMTSVLVAAGVPLAISLPVTIMYRVLTTILQLPPGYYFYHRTIVQGHTLETDDD